MNLIKPDYKRADARNHDLLEQDGLLPAYDNTLVQKMLQESQVLENQINRFMIDTEPKTFTIREMKNQTAFWEIEFVQPVIQYVPACFRFLTQNIMYYYKAGAFAEYVPSYITNLNHVSLLVNYNKSNSEFSNNAEGILNQYELDGGKKMIFSSLNIVLKGAYKGRVLPETAQTAVRNSFEHCFWNLPVPLHLEEVSCINNLIYSRSNEIFDILMTRKTLVKILKIEKRKEKRTLLKKEISGYTSQVLLLSDDGHGIKTSKMTVFLVEDVADSLSENDIFNAVLTSTVKSRTGRFFVIGKIGDVVTPDNMHSIISLVFWKMLQEIEDNSSPTKIGTANQIKTQLTAAIQSNSRFFSSENFSIDMLGWTKDIPKKISQCVADMSPLFFEHDDDVYQLSSVLLGFVVTLCPELLHNREFLLSLVTMFDTAKINSNQYGDHAKKALRHSEQYRYIQNNEIVKNPEKILAAKPRLLNRMVYSRIFSQHYTNW